MKLSEHKISKVLKEQDVDKSRSAVSQTSGYMKLCCYAVKMLNQNNIVCTFENICAALWVMFPKVDKMHLFGFDDIPDTDMMMKAIKMRSWHDYFVFGGGNSKDKKSKEPWYLTEKGAMWAKEVEGILSGTIVTNSQEQVRTQGSSDMHTKLLEKILLKEVKDNDGNVIGTQDNDLYAMYKENPEVETIRKSIIATTLGIYFMDRTFKADYDQKKKELSNILKQRKIENNSSELDVQLIDFLKWIERYVN
jgi:hypothetical protein